MATTFVECRIFAENGDRAVIYARIRRANQCISRSGCCISGRFNGLPDLYCLFKYYGWFCELIANPRLRWWTFLIPIIGIGLSASRSLDLPKLGFVVRNWIF